MVIRVVKLLKDDLSNIYCQLSRATERSIKLTVEECWDKLSEAKYEDKDAELLYNSGMKDICLNCYLTDTYPEKKCYYPDEEPNNPKSLEDFTKAESILFLAYCYNREKNYELVLKFVKEVFDSNLYFDDRYFTSN